MAARKTKFLSDEHRLKIQTSQLINRLTNFVNGEVELSPAQVTAALGLLKKSLPDLSAVSSGADENGSLQGVKAVLDEINGRSAGLPEAERPTLQ
jgi:hypothetical protein